MNADEIAEMTEHVRGHITDRMSGTRMTIEEAEAEFDDWLASRDRQKQAEAWSKGFDAGQKCTHVTLDEPCTPNPYRKKAIK